MKIPVYLKAQHPGTALPHHSTTASMAALLVRHHPSLIFWVSGDRKALQMKTELAWRELKRLVRPEVGGKRVIPRLLPPQRPIALMLSYPPAPQGTDGRRQQRELWMRAERF